MAVCLLCPENLNNKDASEIVFLKCRHSFCWTCLNVYLNEKMSCKIKCPEWSCDKNISDVIIRKTLSPEDICKYERCCLNVPQPIHHCLLPQCTGYTCFTDTNVQYKCNVCSLYNCVLCRAAHCYYTCTQYKALSASEKRSVCTEELDRAWKTFRRLRGLQRRKVLLEEDAMDVLLNEGVFTCGLCSCSKSKYEGLKLRSCQHSFCELCLIGHIETCNNTVVKCPQENCDKTLDDREIQRILSRELLLLYLMKCNNQLKSKLRYHVQCKYPDCGTLYHCSVLPLYFTCTKCNHSNCVSCNAIHSPENCNKTDSNLFIEEEIKAKRLMRCLDCKQLLNKVSGCNWVSCPGCGMELCWITQNYRWGKNGPGDTSGGCRCGVGGKQCSPECKSSCIPHSSRRHARYTNNS